MTKNVAPLGNSKDGNVESKAPAAIRSLASAVKEVPEKSAARARGMAESVRNRSGNLLHKAAHPMAVTCESWVSNHKKRVDAIKRKLKGSRLEQPLNDALTLVHDEAKWKSNGTARKNGGTRRLSRASQGRAKGAQQGRGKAKSTPSDHRPAV